MDIIIHKHVLHNALRFGGKVRPDVVLGAVLKERPELKTDIPKLRKAIEEKISQATKLSASDIKKELEKLAPELLQEKKEVAIGPLKPLSHAIPGKVVLRIAPSPSGPLHIGHAYGVSLNYEYAKMYDGKLLLRIEDTNPENIYPPAYEMIQRDAGWLTDNGVAEVIIQSSRLGKYYDAAEKLVQLGKAYVCTCDNDQWREMKKEGKACPCRELPTKEQQLRYGKMFSSYAEGEAVLRLKTDIQHPNPAMRDVGIMRINEHIHPKTGKEQRVWPLMIFAVAVDDHDLGVTHVLNGKDHADNAMKEQIIMGYLGWKSPEYQHWGMINFVGMHLSTSETRVKIEEGAYTGWDDIRLPFLPALRRRGYQPHAFRRFALEMGLSLTDKTVTREEFWKSVNAFNKDSIERQAHRYFMVPDPVQITLKGAPQKRVQIALHPDDPSQGQRELSVTGTVSIAQDDFRRLGEGYVHRLMDYANFRLEGKTFRYVSESYEEYKAAPDRGNIIHWVPAESKLNVEVKLENGNEVRGIGEEALSCAMVGDIIQLERLWFVRIDQKEKNLIRCWYLHR